MVVHSGFLRQEHTELVTVAQHSSTRASQQARFLKCFQLEGAIFLLKNIELY